MKAPPFYRGTFRTDLTTRALYSEGAGIYRILPQGVAAPLDEEDLSTLIRWAAVDRVPLIPRGAGSSVTGSNVGSGIILDLTRMKPRVLQVDPSTRTARTSGSIRWSELNIAAASHGLRLPPDPSSGSFATLGGMVSTNASGARSLRYGSMRQWVLGLTALSARGERLELRRGVSSSVPLPRRALLQARDAIRARFPRTAKNSAGYALDAWLESGDTLDLLVGAEGTLAIITEIEWQLAPIPRYRAGLRVTLAHLADLTETVETLREFSPSAVELLDRTFLDLLDQARPGDPARASAPPESILLVEFEGEDQKAIRGVVGDAVRRLKNIAQDLETALTPEEEEGLWRIRHAASPIIADLPPGRRSLQVIEDACVPVPRMGEYITAVRGLAERVQVPIVVFGHAGDGNIHVNLLPATDHPGWESAVATLHREITAEVIRLGGTTSGEHGDGRIRSSLLEPLYGREIVDLFRQIKDAFDPLGILNPGVKLPVRDQPSPLSDLKVGSGAAPIPPEIAERLREIERRGDYLTDRLAPA